MSCQITLVLRTLFLFSLCFFSEGPDSKSAEEFSVQSGKESIILSALWKEIYGEFPAVVIPHDRPTDSAPSPSPAPVSQEEKKSKGEAYVQEALKKNRELIKKQNEEKKQKEKEAELSYEGEKSFVEEMKNKEKDFHKEAKKESDDSYKKWQEERDSTYREWALARDQFLGRIKEYKENLYPFESTLLGSSNQLASVSSPPAVPKEKKESLLNKNGQSDGRYFFVKGALEIPIKDQGNRPTCSAFAGIRGVEILWWQREKNYLPFSEQYFYYASKPNCQMERCEKKGSWVVPGLEKSLGSSNPDIPKESDCSYLKSPKEGNETQLPLSSSCQKGKVKVKRFSYAKTFDEILMALTRDRPVIGGFRLSENFYHNQGVVYLSDAISGGKSVALNQHAKGHALLLVGYIDLPRERHSREGKLCLVVANSWGEGFGRGGHSCISEKWFERYRFEIPFVVIEEIQ